MIHVIKYSPTWMSREDSKWLVNGLQPTYKYGVLVLYSLFTNHLLTSWGIQVAYT